MGTRRYLLFIHMGPVAVNMSKNYVFCLTQRAMGYLLFIHMGFLSYPKGYRLSVLHTYRFSVLSKGL